MYKVIPYPTQRAPGPLLLKKSPRVPADVQSETKKIELVRYNQKTRVDELYPKLAKAFLHEVYISLSTSSLATITCVSLAYQ